MEILFVCSGNTCRSPMAEVIFNNEFTDLKAKSRGLFVNPGSVITKNASVLLTNEYGYDIERRAIQLNSEDIFSSDYVVTMTESQKEILKNQYELENIYTLSELAKENGDVRDPFGGSIRIYEKVFEQIKTLIKNTEWYNI